MTKKKKELSNKVVTHAHIPGCWLCEIRKPGCLWNMHVDWRGVDCPKCLDMWEWNGPHEKVGVPGDSAT